MDPNATLAEIRKLITQEHVATLELSDYARLAELMEALDGWITKGGFLPEAWSR